MKLLLLICVGISLTAANIEDTASVYDEDLDGMRMRRATEDETSELVAQNLSHQTVNKLNEQIQAELGAAHQYLAMYAFFSRGDVSYRGFAKFFKAAAEEEREHGQLIIDYLNERGGYVMLKTIDEPTSKEWWSDVGEQTASPYKAIKMAHKMEKEINQKLLDIHSNKNGKSSVNDPHLEDFLETHFLNEQVESIKQLSDWLSVLGRLKDHPFGIHQFDEELFNGSRK